MLLLRVLILGTPGVCRPHLENIYSKHGTLCQLMGLTVKLEPTCSVGPCKHQYGFLSSLPSLVFSEKCRLPCCRQCSDPGEEACSHWVSCFLPQCSPLPSCKSEVPSRQKWFPPLFPILALFFPTFTAWQWEAPVYPIPIIRIHPRAFRLCDILLKSWVCCHWSSYFCLANFCLFRAFPLAS